MATGATDPGNEAAPRLAPRGGGLQAAQSSTQRQYTAGIDAVLVRLDRVRKSGRGYTARCPAHEDRSASLSVSEGTDGRVLLHCFAGCGAADVVAALGLTLADLFPRRITSSPSREDRRALAEGARMAQWRAALAVLSREATVIEVAAVMVASAALGPHDLERLHLAASRVADALAVLR